MERVLGQVVVPECPSAHTEHRRPVPPNEFLERRLAPGVREPAHQLPVRLVAGGEAKKESRQGGDRHAGAPSDRSLSYLKAGRRRVAENRETMKVGVGRFRRTGCHCWSGLSDLDAGLACNSRDRSPPSAPAVIYQGM
ncbi:hypothetical protein FTUN_0796 [Frigoriglobus tundricola]|uniref:Uncharacterized protein n=1 Tax=Frigoriglobus tundricola TaxID=2774151 RepID=A0A6M5YIY2_9BACT|nr:hypothetical protein FTUN_0796 [Frigoriglobus tundricola]